METTIMAQVLHHTHIPYVRIVISSSSSSTTTTTTATTTTTTTLIIACMFFMASGSPFPGSFVQKPSVIYASRDPHFYSGRFSLKTNRSVFRFSKTHVPENAVTARSNEKARIHQLPLPATGYHCVKLRMPLHAKRSHLHS